MEANSKSLSKDLGVVSRYSLILCMHFFLKNNNKEGKQTVNKQETPVSISVKAHVSAIPTPTGKDPILYSWPLAL